MSKKNYYVHTANNILCCCRLISEKKYAKNKEINILYKSEKKRISAQKTEEKNAKMEH